MLKVQLEILFKSGVEKYYIEKIDQEKFAEIVDIAKVNMGGQNTIEDYNRISFGTGSSGTVIRMSSVDSISISAVD